MLASWVTWTPNAPAAAPIGGLRVPAVFSGAQVSSQSYLRFYNAGSSTGTVNLTLSNAATGEPLATWTSPSIPAGSAQQFFIKDIEAASSATFTKPQFYSLSVRPTFTGYLQHVLWQISGNTLSNLSTCDTGAFRDPKTLIGVHSSRLQSGYPSTVVVHNTGSSSVSMALGIYDARDGMRLGTYATGALQPNAQKIVTVAAMEIAAHVTPSAAMNHYIIKTDTVFSGYLQHLLTNTSDSSVADMTGVCRITP